MSLPGRARLPAEAGRVPGVAVGERGRVELLVHVVRGERDLRGSGEVELVALDPVDVHLVRREEAGAVHGRLADEHRREDGREALLRQPVEGEAVERELGKRDVAEAVGEARPRDLRTALHVDLAELEVVARLEAERRRVARPAHLDRVLLGEAVGRARVGRIRDAGEQLVPLRGLLLERRLGLP